MACSEQGMGRVRFVLRQDPSGFPMEERVNRKEQDRGGNEGGG